NLATVEKDGELTRRVWDLGMEVAQAEFVAAAAGPTDRAATARRVELAKLALSQAVRKRDSQLRQLRRELKRLKEAGPLSAAPLGVRTPRHPADASRLAGMAGRRLRRLGLVGQGHAPSDHAFRDLPARLRTRLGRRGRRHRQRLVLAVRPPPARRGSAPR